MRWKRSEDVVVGVVKVRIITSVGSLAVGIGLVMLMLSYYGEFVYYL